MFRKILFSVYLLLFASIFFACSSELFVVPNGITSIESEAFSDIQADSVYLPLSVSYCSKDAFPATVSEIFGKSNTYAERFARENDYTFISTDITSLNVDCPAFVSPGRTFALHLEYDCLFPVTGFSIDFSKDGTSYFVTESSAPEFSATLSEPGIYDLTIGYTDRFGTSYFTVECCTEVYKPVALVENDFIAAPGDVIYPTDDTEAREVSYISDSDGIIANGNSVIAVNPGVYTLTAVADCGSGFCYTDFTVQVIESATSISFAEEHITLTRGETFALIPEIQPAHLSDRPVTYVSSDTAIAEVSEDGIVTAISEGKCIITASVFRVSVDVPVHVYIPAESISITTSQPNPFTNGMSYQFKAEVYPQDADDISVIWSVNDTEIAEIDADTGLLKAHKAGYVTVSAKAADGFGAVAYTVIEILQGIEQIDVSLPNALYSGCTYSPVVTVLPNADCPNSYELVSSNSSVLRVNSDGTVTALSSGSVVLSAITDNGVTESLPCTVSTAPESLTTYQTSVYLNIGRSFNVKDIINVQPNDSDISGLTCSVSNPTIAEVSSSGKVTGLAEGVCVITTRLGNLASQITVNVVAGSVTETAPSISPAYIILTAGKTGTVTPVWSAPTSAQHKRGVWVSDDTSIMTVAGVNADGSAKLLGISEGVTKIKLLTSSGISAERIVVVNPRVPDSISLSESDISVESGSSTQLTVLFYPEGSRENNMEWYSSDTSVAVVDDRGLITAKGAGICRITCTLPSGKSASCSVTVPVICMESAETASEIIGKAGDSFAVSYTFTPEVATPAAFKWFSDDTGVATIDEDTGIGQYIAEGETYIHGIAIDGSGIILDVHISVYEIPVKKLAVSSKDISLKVGETASITYSIYPSDASYSDARFESTDESVATVDSNGNILAIGKGSCAICVYAGNGDYAHSASINVTVTSDGTVTYRALVMGQFTVPGTSGYLPFSVNGTRGVYDALGRSVIDGEKYSIKFMPNSPSLDSFLSAVNTLSTQADEDDVTVIYVLAHGHYKSGKYSFSTSAGEYCYGDTLINAVSKVSGHVVLVICSCNSGYIFNSCAPLKTIMSAGGVYQGRNGTGHLTVLCSATDTISSYYNINNAQLSYDFFSKAFTSGLGWNMLSDCSQVMSADKNNDRSVTVSEICSWSRSKTQYDISAFIQTNGMSQFHGNASQLPSWFIASGDEDLVILSK